MIIDIKFIDPRVKIHYGSAGSAGMDLYACNFTANDENFILDHGTTIVLDPGCHVLIGTGIAMHIYHPTHFGMIVPRSGLGSKHGVVLRNGTGIIDSDYTGEVLVCLYNTGTEPYVIHPMDRIAQLLVLPVQRPQWRVVDELQHTERGNGGMGSTGK